MSNTVNPFGCTYLNLNVALCKMGRTSQMMFNFYVACRLEIKGWEYNAPDIVERTGITKKAVLGYCRAMEKAGLFIKSGVTSMGATKYKLDKAKFKHYLQGRTPLEPIFAKEFKREDKSEEVLTPPLASGSETPSKEVLTPHTGGSENPLNGVPTTNKDIIIEERENEKHTPKMACVSAFSHSPEENNNTDADKVVCQVNAAPRDDSRAKDLAAKVAAFRKERPDLSDNVTDGDISRHIQRIEWKALEEKEKEEAKIKRKEI